MRSDSDLWESLPIRGVVPTFTSGPQAGRKIVILLICLSLWAVLSSCGKQEENIDKTWKMVIKPQFDGVSRFFEGLARVSVGVKRCYIDKTGQYIWKPTK